MIAWAEEAARAPGGILQRAFGGETVILHVDRATFFGLDDVGDAMRCALIQAPTIQRAFEALLAMFEVEGPILQRDLSAFLDALRAQGLIEIIPASPAAGEDVEPAGPVRRARAYARPDLFVYGPIRELTHASPVRRGTLEVRAARSG